MTIDDIKKLIATDESRVLELKTSTGELVKGMQTLCAFLNSDGGWLFFGITPKLEVLGQNVTDNTQREIAHEITKIEPAIKLPLEIVEVPDRPECYALYPSVRYRTGDLSRKGWQQQQELAERMYQNNPEIFKGDATVRSWVSTSTRCVMTMSSFCLGLKGMNPKLDIFENFGYTFLPAILPLDNHNPFRVKDVPMTPLKFDETWEHYIDRTLDYNAILARLFNTPGKAVPAEKAWDLVSYLYFFAAGMNSLDTDLDFNDIFTPEERIALWKIDNYQFYMYAWPTHEGYMPIVRDIIEKADARIAAGERGADLRFGHDYTFLPLLMCLDVNGYGHSVENSDDIPVWCRLQDVPMGANLHLVFYRPKRSGPILFKVLLNGQEARLPIPTDNWPYYRWDYFKQAYGPTAVLQPK